MEYIKWGTNIVITGNSPVLDSANKEIVRGLKGMLGINPSVRNSFNKPQDSHSIVLGTFGSSEAIDEVIGKNELNLIKEEGFIIKKVETTDKNYIIVAGKTDKGVLYGVFYLLRLIQMQISPDYFNRVENPQSPLRMLNHWDNMDGSVERGYAGKSIFFSEGKITGTSQRTIEYARLLSSVGINGIVLNNVNVKENATLLITKKYLPRVAKIAGIFREYGIKTYLSINYASPVELGGLTTADPLDPRVREWWKEKSAEIYSYIKDFGGFLVKADSEFRPGPFTYNRNHAEGANVLAEALEPFGGLVIWRCFVYNCVQDWRDYSTDRARAAYDNFKPLDGKFKENVILQIKNGPMDFQVREPVSPLLGGMENTNQILEFQITQEYTGQQEHLCYLIPQWKETLDFDTYSKGEGSSVKKIIDGSVFHRKHNGIAGVSNIGDDYNWTGHTLAQSNLYGFGRLAWNSELSSKEIADEWVRLTFTNYPKVVDTIVGMLLSSWKIYEDYTAPLGIGWMVNPNHHYGPNADGYEYSKWGTYHRADSVGIGVDRTIGLGTGYIAQYHPINAMKYETIETCPEELLLFFHRVPYNHRLNSGESVIQHIYNTHFEGAEKAAELKEQWLSLNGLIDEIKFEQVLRKLEIQIGDAKEWRDVINSYFYRKTGIEDELGRKIY